MLEYLKNMFLIKYNDNQYQTIKQVINMVNIINIDKSYSIQCVGDAVVGDEISFNRALFKFICGQVVFDRGEIFSGRIIKETDKCYILETKNGKQKIISQKVMFREKLFRKSWIVESDREKLAIEKRIKNINQAHYNDQTKDMFEFDLA